MLRQNRATKNHSAFLWSSRSLGAGFLAAWMLFAVKGQAAGSDMFRVDPDMGNSSLRASFDAPFGELIHAVTSKVGCDLKIDVNTGTYAGRCAFPLTSLMVDGDATKTDHLYQWATNKKTDPMTCEFILDVQGVAGKLVAKTPVAFKNQGTLTICGKNHESGKKETITGSFLWLPDGSYGKGDVVRIRAEIADFDREAYRVGPKHTAGWLSRVQQLAPVVAKKGSIAVNLFARHQKASESESGKNESKKQ